MTNKGLRKRLARAIIIDRATPESASFIDRVARGRSQENYRFAGRFVGGKAVLDIGGGTGIGHDLLLAGGAASILSLDLHVAATTQNDKVRSVVGDFLTYPLNDAQFDVVICLGTIFYLDDANAALEKMHRLLAPGGMLVINCINQQLVRRYFEMPLEEIDAKFSTAYDEPGFRAVLKAHFDAEPKLYVQQPVPVSRALRDVLAFC